MTCDLGVFLGWGGAEENAVEHGAGRMLAFG